MLTKNRILLRFVITWILLSGIFSLLFWGRDFIVYEKKIGKNWQFSPPVFHETILAVTGMFFFICAIFYLLEHFFLFKKKRIWLKVATLILIIYVVIVLLASNAIGFSFESILRFQPLFFILLFTVAILSVDNLVKIVITKNRKKE